MAIRFLEDVHGYAKGQVVNDLGGGLEDAYVNGSHCAVLIHPDGTETDGAGKLFHVCSHCDGTGREPDREVSVMKTFEAPAADKMVGSPVVKRKPGRPKKTEVQPAMTADQPQPVEAAIETK